MNPFLVAHMTMFVWGLMVGFLLGMAVSAWITRRQTIRSSTRALLIILGAFIALGLVLGLLIAVS